ncbi:MAG: NnrU family protein [Parvularculales bacterium]
MFEAGIIIFFGVHLIPLFTNLKSFLQSKLGEYPYKGIFALISLAGLLMIIFGYESGTNYHYSVYPNAYLYSTYVMFFSLTFLVAANLPTYIKKITRHPMSLGIAVWAILHLAVNPDTYSIILFGSFLAYSAVSALVSELRDEKKKASDAKIIFDALSVVLGIFITYLAFNYHEYISGAILV